MNALKNDLQLMQLQENIGIKKWELWIQKGPRKECFCIQVIESDLGDAIMERLYGEMPRSGYVEKLHQFFQEGLSCEHSLMDPLVKILPVLDLGMDHRHSGKWYDYCYMLPLLFGMEDVHKDYCRAAMHENREATIVACKAFGMIEMKKWIQHSAGRFYVIYYQRMTQPIDESKRAFLKLNDHPNAMKATQTLRNQTGLAFEELHPDVVRLQFKIGSSSDRPMAGF